jgi:heterodisulfide reductase subunit B
MFTLREQAQKLSAMILSSIQDTDADLIVTPCGLCQLNLEIAARKTLPIYNIGQMLGLALGLDPGKLHMKKLRISDKQVIKFDNN